MIRRSLALAGLIGGGALVFAAAALASGAASVADLKRLRARR
jgi:hypothetical protein